MKNLFAILVMLIVLNEPVYPQQFEGGLQGGFNATQVDGDRNAGYNKLGFNGGVFLHYVLPDKQHSIGFDLMYMGKGSRNRRDPEGLDPILIYSYHYVELPLYYRYIHKKFAFRSGLTWAYVFSSKFDDGGSAKEIIGLRNVDYLWHCGGEYAFNEQFALFIGYEYSIRTIIKRDFYLLPSPIDQFRRNGVYHNLIQVSLKYNFTK